MKISLALQKLTVLGIVVTVGIAATAAIKYPITVPPAQWRREKTLHVATAKVLLADYDLIKKDFPQFRDLQAVDYHKIDEWLIRQTAFVAAPQAAQSVVNSPIQTDGEGQALRPAHYQRALVFEVEGGLIDAKGNGAIAPAQKSHGNGLSTLGEAIKEFLYEKLVTKILRRENLSAETVGCYAVIDFGFDVVEADGSKSRAGSVLRQSSPRQKPAADVNYFIDQEPMKIIENALRKYGVTSAGDTWGEGDFDEVNMQGDINGALVDYGSYMTVGEFTRTTIRYLRPDKVLFKPTDLDFPRIDEGVRVPYHVWGSSETGRENPRFDNVWIYSHRLAEAIREGYADRAAAEYHFTAMFGELNQEWQLHPQAPGPDRYLPYRIRQFTAKFRKNTGGPASTNVQWTQRTKDQLNDLLIAVLANGEPAEVDKLIRFSKNLGADWNQDWLSHRYLAPLVEKLILRAPPEQLRECAIELLSRGNQKVQLVRTFFSKIEMAGSTGLAVKSLRLYAREMGQQNPNFSLKLFSEEISTLRAFSQGLTRQTAPQCRAVFE